MTDENKSVEPQGISDNNDFQEDMPTPSSQPASLAGMTMEQIVDLTGEFSHLNELVMIHIELAGGFTGTDAYFRIVQPVLDLLEVEIRVRCRTGITQQQMKLVVQDWIDQEIRACRDGNRASLI